MQDIIVPIDILERFESENDVSAAPPDDLLYVFCPNRKEDKTISSYSAFPMTVRNLQDLYPDPPNPNSEEGFCTFEQYNQVYNKFLLISSYYQNVIRPIILSAFPEPKQLTANYMCRVERNSKNFPYSTSWNSESAKRTPATVNSYDIRRDDGTFVVSSYSQLSVVTKRRTYHEWADYQTHVTDLSVLARLAHNKNGSQDIRLNNPDTIATDKYLEWRKQFVISLLMNRKRRLMTNTDLYSQAIKVSRMIRFSDKHIDTQHTVEGLQLGDEHLLD